MARVRVRSAVLIAIAGVAIPVSAGASGIHVGTTVNVSADRFADNEESFGMNPSGTWLAGAWNDFDFNDGCGFSFSTDGGKSFAPRSFVPGFTAFTNDPSIPGTGTFAVAGDPAVEFNPKFNTFDVVCQAFGATGGAINLLATTFDPIKADPVANENASYVGARNPWTHPVAIATGTSNGTQKGSTGHFPDHEFLVIDTGNGAGHHFGRAFVTWAEFNGNFRSSIDLAFSDDNGQTWSGPIGVSDAGHKFDQDARTTIGPDGTVYVSFDSGPNATSFGKEVDIAASHDGGQTFGPTVPMAQLINPVPGLLPNSQYRVFSDVWSSASSSGIVTAVFNDQRNGHSNIYAVHNLAPGDLTRWSSPVGVKTSAKEEFFPWVETSPSGNRLDLTFYDRSNDPANTKNWVDYASSTDNGATWTVTTATSVGADLDMFQACLAFVQPSNCGDFFIGDYIALVSTETAVHLFYTWNGPAAQDVFETNLRF